MEINLDFWDKLIIPATGVIVTVYLFFRDRANKRADEKKNQKQKIEQQEKQERDARIKELQRFLDNLNTVFWNWRYLAKKVPYYAATNPEQFKLAAKNYSDNIWDVLTTIKILDTRAKILFGDSLKAPFKDIYEYMAYNIDPKVESLIQMEGKAEFENKAHELSKLFSDEVSNELTGKIEQMISILKYAEEQLQTVKTK
jgi:hypothetical protein